ncbi:hypothetical protein BK809_0006939 [Diplodia seriata]|uniref:F-box domain-containing protein n=1 Tax=Diplodia seriata TaxID=420778 RepID=A0A1S8B560_9PEZI|nr:hypothetical protein BK809_0006939 [Diplodia seriata]
MAKREKVLQTTELLELILAALPIKDLLLAQRVCRRFASLIQTSTALQQALFFLPLPASSTRAPATTPALPLRSYPSGALVTETWERNPLLASAFPPWFDRQAPGSIYSPPFYHPAAFETLPLNAARDAYLRPEASWRRMLVTQPPATALGVSRYTHGMGGDALADATLAMPPGCGVTMGVLYDAACQQVLREHWQFPVFRVQWHGGERRVVFYVRQVMQCCRHETDEEDARWGAFFSKAFEPLGLGWKQAGWRWRRYEGRVIPESEVKEGDYEAEVALAG